ncbi:DUF6090 family protein [Seonamhaeicola maritimus]|uniref:Uncharacterized protein n=1 Tax=Seonamhaeicola maritimus TaxID=2591822 RepID=A0A5C7GKS4_9FLAO|nr:DUF6090 family protein [Seonamhaeicola maritimus]TXG38717.1 hypothetical protein FUA22_02190 [Seonamhaeicola maritimus]
MIKFFRNIRKKLLKEGKTVKYFKYAIGEIILVVIGILIALQINNWNENQRLLKKEHYILVSVTKELEDNLKQLKNGISINTNYLNSLSTYIKNPAIRHNLDSEMFKSLMSYFPATINSPILNDILETDKGEIISNSLYMGKFRKLRISYNLIEKQEFYLDEFWNSKATDFMIQEEVSLDDLESESDIATKNKKLQNLINSQKLLTLLSIKKILQRDWFNNQMEALTKSEHVLATLKHELEKD